MTIDVESPITGTVWKILVTEGQAVQIEEPLLILESMKMEVPVEATESGKVLSILVKEGVAVEEGDALVTLEV